MIRRSLRRFRQRWTVAAHDDKTATFGCGVITVSWGMIIVHGTIPLKPDCREQALELARQMAEASTSEVGCISYDFYLGLLDENVLMLFQEWESMESLRDHFQTEHMEEFMRVLPEYLAGEIVTRRFAVQNVDEGEDHSMSDPRPIIH